jgi:hypothetical protein
MMGIMRRVPCGVSPTISAGSSFTFKSQKYSSAGAVWAWDVEMLIRIRRRIFFIGLDFASIY